MFVELSLLRKNPYTIQRSTTLSRQIDKNLTNTRGNSQVNYSTLLESLKTLLVPTTSNKESLETATISLSLAILLDIQSLLRPDLSLKKPMKLEFMCWTSSLTAMKLQSWSMNTCLSSLERSQLSPRAQIETSGSAWSRKHGRNSTELTWGVQADYHLSQLAMWWVFQQIVVIIVQWVRKSSSKC